MPRLPDSVQKNFSPIFQNNIVLKCKLCEYSISVHVDLRVMRTHLKKEHEELIEL